MKPRNKLIGILVALALPVIGVLGGGCESYREFRTSEGCYRNETIWGDVYFSKNCDGNWTYIGNAEELNKRASQKNYPSAEEKISGDGLIPV